MSRTLIISDVHANAPALDAVLAAEPDRDSVVFLGDAVDNGPHPNAVCNRLHGLDITAGVVGNHDRTVLDASIPSESADDPFAEWQEWTHDQLSEKNQVFLESLDRTATVVAENRSLRLHHGDFPPPEGHNSEWSTRVTPEENASLFEEIADRYDEDVVLHGHSHFPFEATVAGTTFVNPGSVGLQRDNWPADHARYATLEDGMFDLRAVPYDTSAVTTDSRRLNSPFVDIWNRPTPNATPD